MGTLLVTATVDRMRAARALTRAAFTWRLSYVSRVESGAVSFFPGA